MTLQTATVLDPMWDAPDAFDHNTKPDILVPICSYLKYRPKSRKLEIFLLPVWSAGDTYWRYLVRWTGNYNGKSLSTHLEATLKYLSFFIGIIPIAIIGPTSRFDPGLSTHAQRISIMLWLVWGIFLGWLVTIWQSSDVLEKN